MTSIMLQIQPLMTFTIKLSHKSHVFENIQATKLRSFYFSIFLVDVAFFGPPASTNMQLKTFGQNYLLFVEIQRVELWIIAHFHQCQ